MKNGKPRARTLLGGVIAFNNHASTMDCQVRNLSIGGAKVTFSNTAAVPDQFDLKIARKERSFRARMIWRAPNEAGVAFLSEYNQDVPVPLEWAKRLRDCEAEKAILRKRVARLSGRGGV
ncbi:MAG TPA: PilZ domain-containing protein [Pseudolabrys sp.]|nr:PilZ domain-containing protein [Pseudolabrys sp.]